MAPINAHDLRVKEKRLNVTLAKCAGEAEVGEVITELEEEALRKEFSTYGPLEAVAVHGNKALLTFDHSSSIDSVFKRCKIPDDGDVSPELWIKYRADDQGKYCVMIPVKRPPPPGPHASKISEDTKWSIREAFEDAVKSAESPADALSIAGCLNLVNHLLKDPEDKLSESEVARIFDEAESIKSGIPIDFYSFLEVFSAIQEAAGSSAAEPDESGLGRNEADAPSDPTTAPVVGNAAVAVQDDSGGATEVDQSEKNLSTTTPETEAVVGTAHSVASGSLDDVTAKLQDSNPETETSPVHTSLTASELALAKEIFAEATSAGSGSSVGVMGIDVFKKTMLKLVNEMNEAAVAAGDKKTPAPAEKDLVAAFKQADTEKSGTADELNFIRLVDKVKTGAIKGLGGGMLSSLFTSRRKSAHKDEAEVSSLPSPSVATKGRSNSASNDEGSGGGFLSSIFTSKKKAAMAPNLAQAEKLHEHNDSGVGGELKEAEQRIVKKAFDSVAEKTTDSGDTLMSKEAFQMHVNNQYMVSSVVEPKENEIEVAYSSMGNSTEGVSKEEFVRFAALVKIGKVAGFSYEILFHSAVSIEDDAISSFVALDNSGRIKVLQGLPASEHVAYISKLESLHDRANIIMGLPTEVSAALLVELRLHGDFGDLLAVMPGKAAKKAVQGVLESGGRTKTGLVALHKGIPKNIGSQLVSCNSARDVSKLLCSLPTAQAASLLLEFHSRGAAGPVFDGMVSVASAGAAALLAQVSLVERSNLVSSLAITNRAIVLGYVTDDDKDTILEGMRATDKDETLAAISHSEDDFIVSFSVTLQDESVDSFGSEKRSAFVAATSAALGVSTSQVVVESVRAGSAVVSVQVSGLQNEEVAKSVVSKASEPKLLVAQLNEAGLGECSVSEVTTSRSNTADPPNNDALPNTAQTVQDNDEISGGEDAGAAETSTSHNDGSVTGDEDDAEVLMPQAKSEVVEENSVVQIAPDGKSDSGGNEDFEVLDPHLLESRNLANRENTVVTEFPGDPEADQIVGSTDLAAELSKGEVQPSPAEIQEVSSEEDEADDLPKKKASARIEDDNGKEQPSPAKIEEISSEEDENEILPYKTTSAKNEDPVSDFSSSEARDDEIRPSHEVEEVDAKGQNTDLGSTASEKIGQLSKEFVDAQPTSPASKALELSEEEGEDDERGTAVEATSTAQHSAQKPFQGLEVSSEEEEDDEADSAYQKHKEIPLASKREEPPVDVGTEENFGGVDSDGSEANDGSIDFDESESDPRLNELSAQSQGRNETASVSGLNGPSVANIPSLAAPSPQVRESVHNEEDFCISPQKGPTSGVSESSTQDVLPMSPAGLSVSAIQCNDAPSMDEPARGSALDMSSLAMDDDTLKSPIKRTVHEECEPIAEGVKDFDDESQVLQELETVDKPSAFAPGLAVESRFGGKTKYYGAKIVQQNSDGTYEVHYDDGDIEKAVHSDNICLFARAKQFPVGVRVEARFGGKNTWYPGEVAKDNGDGTYEVHYDDGDVDTAAKFLRALDAADDVHDSQESGEEEESVKGSNEVVAAQNENLMPDESGLELATELMEEVELELEITFPEWQLADFGASAREGLQADLEKCLPLRQGQDVRVVNLRAGSVVADLHISGFGTALEVDAFVAQAVSGKFVLDPTTYGNGVVWAPKEGALENPSTAVKEAVPTTDEGIVDEEEAAKFFTSREDEEEEEVVAENEIESTIEGQAKVAEDAADAQLQEENELAIAKEREETEEEGEREVALTSKTKGIESANAKPEDEIQPAAATEQEEVSISVIAMDAEALPTQTKEKGGEEVVAAVQTEAANEAHAAIEVEEHDDEQTIANKSDGDSPSKNKDNGAVADDGPVSPVAASATEPKEDGQINDDDAGAVSLKEQEDIVNVRSEGAEVASLKAETPPSAEGSGALKSGEETSLVPATMVQEHEQADAAVTTTSPSEVRAEDAPHALKSNDDAAEPPLEGGMESDDSMKKEAVAGLTVTSTTTSTVVTIAPAAALPTSPDTALPLSDTASPSTNTLNPAGDASIPPPSTTNLLEPSEVAATAALSPEVLSDASAAAAAAESRAVAAEQALQSERAASEQAAMAARAATDLAIAEAARQAILEAEARASADLDAERLQSKEKRDVLAEEVAALRAQAVETAEALTKAQSDAETASEELAEKVSALGEMEAQATSEQMAKEDLQQRLSAAEAELQVQLVRMQSAETELDDLRGKLDERHLLEAKLAERDTEVLELNEQVRAQNEEVSRLTALLEDQELRPSAAENSSAEEEREGKGKGKDQQEATGRGVEEAHIQEEVIQGLKEQLASAVAAQENLEVQQQQLQADCATLKAQALQWEERATLAEAEVQRLNSQLREVEDNGREGVLFQTAAVVEVTTAASSEIPNKNRDVVLREANTDPSTTPAPPEEDATDTPKLTATTSAPSADTDRPVAAAVNGLSTKPTPVPAAAADAHTEAVVHVEPPVQSREILEGILQQRTREWENEMTERLESEVRLVHAQVAALRDHYTLNANSEPAAPPGMGSVPSAPLSPLPLPLPPSPLAAGDWNALLSHTGRSAAANAMAWEARVAQLGSPLSRRNTAGDNRGNNNGGSSSSHPSRLTSTLYGARPSPVLDGGGTAFCAHPALNTAHASGTTGRRSATAAADFSSYHIRSPTKRSSTYPSSDPSSSSSLPHYHRPHNAYSSSVADAHTAYSSSNSISHAYASSRSLRSPPASRPPAATYNRSGRYDSGYGATAIGTGTAYASTLNLGSTPVLMTARYPSYPGRNP